MRLIDANELRQALDLLVDDRHHLPGWNEAIGIALEAIDAAPTVDVPQPLTRDGVLAEVARIEAAGDTAVVEVLWPFLGAWSEAEHDEVKCWGNPDVPRWNVRVRAVPAETEWVPLTRLVGRTMVCRTKAVEATELRFAITPPHGPEWLAPNGYWVPVPLDADDRVEVLAEGDA